jgi:hypothetical protein
MSPYYQVHKENNEGINRDMEEQKHDQTEVKSNKGHKFKWFEG